MAGGAAVVVEGTANVDRVEAPITIRAYLLCAFAAFGGIFFGYDTGWMSGVLATPYFISEYTGYQYNYTTNTPIGVSDADFVLPSSLQSLFTSILSCGTFFGALVGGDISDFMGRRPTIIMGCFVFTIGCIMEIASTNQRALFAIGRLVAGGGVGFISAVVILYMSEIAPKRVRGAMVAGYQFCITIGILFANCVVYKSQARPDSGSYRVPIGVQFLWAFVLALGLFFLPDSPRYFIKKGKVEEAAKALSILRGHPTSSPYIKDELAEVVANNEFELQHIPQTSYIGSWTTCFKGGLKTGNTSLRRTLLGSGLQCAQQLTGINFVLYFGPPFFKQLGTIPNPFLITLITTLVNVLSTPVSFVIVEKFGRRALLIYGGIGMVICQYIVASIGITQGTVAAHNNAAVRAEIAFICLNISCFAMTWGPTAWVVVGEIFPLPIRSRGVGISTSSNWLWNTIIAVITPYLVDTNKDNLGPKVFYLWGSLCILSVLFAYFLVPELKGLSLEQADMCMQEVSPRKSAGWRPTHTYAAEMHHVHEDKPLANETVDEKSAV
ncbi:general substrate transporter [Xylariaceae sp. FL0804]|nr:general substrate transporter [Xylariaceae sp. FL0804]